MTYATDLAAFSRTPQMIIELYMTHCDNSYAVNSRPNQLLRSGDLLDASWTKSNITVTGGQPDPMGGVTGFKLEDVSVVATGTCFKNSQIAAAGKTLTFSFWVYADTPRNVTFSLNDSIDAEGTAQTFKLGTGYQRLFITRTFTGGATGNARGHLRATTLTVGETGYIIAWNPQITETAFPLADQVTAATVLDTSTCTATDQGDGARCCYSVPTCQDLPHFKTTQGGPNPGLRVFKFCLKGPPLAVEGIGLLPYLFEPTWLPQEIQPDKAITIRERVVLRFLDDTSSVNFDADKLPGLTNTSTAGTFWRRFREIYRNYTERRVVIKEGFVGNAESEYQTRFDGLMSDLRIESNGICVIEAVNKLKKTARQIPNKISDTNTIATALAINDATLYVTDAGEFRDYSKISTAVKLALEIGWDSQKDLSGVGIITNGSTSVTGIGTLYLSELAAGDLIWCQTDDEVHAEQVSAISSDTGLTLVRSYQGKGGTFRLKAKTSEFVFVTGAPDLVADSLPIQRRRYTTGIGHAFPVGTKIREVIWLSDVTPTDPQPIDAMDAGIDVLQHAGIQDADIDLTGIATQLATWHSGTGSILGIQLVREPVDTDELLSRLSEDGMFSVFQNESQQITFKAYAPPLPSEVMPVYDESAYLIQGTQLVEDSDEDNRLTRVEVGFDLRGEADGDKLGHYHLAVVQIGQTAESPTSFGDRKGKTILSRFLHRSQIFAAIAVAGRKLARFVNGAKGIAFSLELKDASLKLGDFFQINSSRIQSPTGLNYVRTFQVTSKQRATLGRWDFKALEAFGNRRIAFIGPNTMAATYDTRAAADIPYAYIGDANNKVGAAKEDGFYIF